MMSLAGLALVVACSIYAAIDTRRGYRASEAGVAATCFVAGIGATLLVIPLLP